MKATSIQFDVILEICRTLFLEKLKDYGPAFRVLRPSSLTDQIFIKISRIRTLQMTDEQKIEESEEDAWIAVVNYSIIALMQLREGTANDVNTSQKNIIAWYDDFAQQAKNLMLKKNHDYGEAWREMRISSITDLIFQKVLRTKQIEDNNGKTKVSEGLEANYFDMLNYAIFCLIKLEENKTQINPHFI